MTLTILITLYSTAIVAASLFGGLLPSLLRLTHVRMQLALSFVGGMMLGVGLLHMLPHSVVETGSLEYSLQWTLAGLLGMFLLIRTFHFHEHGPVAHEPLPEPFVSSNSLAESAAAHASAPPPSGHAHADACGAHGHHHHHHADHGHGAAELPAGGSAAGSTVGWLGVACGLSLHAFLDGIALAAGVVADLEHRQTAWAGVGVFAAILLHKPLDALSITTLMQARHWSRQAQQLVNAGFAMMCPLGAALFAVLVTQFGETQHAWIGIALAVSAGIFLCISLSDLLPEVQFHHHDRMKLSAALILGVMAAYAIHLVEPAHVHPSAEPSVEESGWAAPQPPPRQDSAESRR